MRKPSDARPARNDTPPRSEFERVSAEERAPSAASETWLFIKRNKKWWLVPMLAVLLLLSALVALSGSAAGPFIYTFF